MKLTSSSFENNQNIPKTYSCDGDNINPPLEISDVPENAKCLALIMDDPDAPSGTFTHWLMWNIAPDTKEILEGDWPENAEQGINDGGELGYMGPCPPSGVHHYHFNLYALSEKLDIPPNSTKEELEKEIEDALIAKSELVGTYSRQN
ncbi:MAG: PEBP family protein [Microgenomates group bacterium GW2011_GWA2_37_6]|nr:MAG: PEBP family protein [Microgenomates group bacterium GW2011_GWA2_37_6]